MELLVYVRNHRGPHGSTSFVGASLGTAPKVEQLDLSGRDRGPVTSMAEFRIDADVDDPIAELRAAVADLFTVIGEEKHGRGVYFARNHSAIKVRLEPGFDTPLDVTRGLAEMLVMCSPKLRQEHPVAAEAGLPMATPA